MTTTQNQGNNGDGRLDLAKQLEIIYSLAPGKHEIRVIGRYYKTVLDGKEIEKVWTKDDGDVKVYGLELAESPKAAIEKIYSHFQSVHNCYVVTNRVADDFCLERKKAKIGNTWTSILPFCTKTGDIAAICSLVIDLDRSVKAKNAEGQYLCASPEELEQINKTRLEIAEYLKSFDLTPNYQVMSGNGYQMTLFFEPQTDIKRTRKIIKAVLEGLNDKYKATVEVDVKLEDPNRVSRLVGILNKKPDRVEDEAQGRVYRIAQLVETNDRLNTFANIEALAKALPQKATKQIAKPQQPTPTYQDNLGQKFDVRSFLASHGILIRQEKSWNDCTLLILENCVFNCEHDKGESCVVVHPDGMLSYQCYHNSCQGKTWLDLRAAVGDAKKQPLCKHCQSPIGFIAENGKWIPVEIDGNTRHHCIKQKIQDRVASITVADDENEFDPRERILGSNRVDKFPLTALPPLLSAFCMEMSETYSTSVDMVALPLLTYLGGVTGANKRIEIKSGWQEAPALYTAIIAPPASGKTPVLSRLDKFLKELEKDNIQRNSEIEQEYDEAEEAYNDDLANYKIAKKRGEKIEKPTKPTKPGYVRLHVSDVTVESLSEILSANPKGVILARDELTGWINSQNQYKGGKGSDKQFWLSAWSGASAPVDRKGKKPIYVDRPFVAVCGGIPPKELAIFQNSMGDGFFDRILPIYPDPIDHAWSDAEIDQDIAGEMLRLFRSLYLDSSERVLLPTLEAKKFFADWYNKNVEEIKLCEEALQNPYGKMPSQMLRIALILAICENPNATEVTLQDMQDAAKIVAYLKTHLRKVLGHLVETGDEKLCRRLMDYAKRRKTERITTRDIYIGKIAKNAKEAKTMLQTLASHRLGSLEKSTFTFSKGIIFKNDD